jgi:hypothetical protein
MRYGRCDIWLRNKKNNQELIYIYEFKKVNKLEELMEGCKEGIEQIEE